MAGSDYARAEAQDCHGARPSAAERFQVDLGQARCREEDAVAEQHRQHVDQDLVDEPPPQALAGHVGTEDLQILGAGGPARRRDRLAGGGMKPSSDIALFTTTLPSPVFVSLIRASRKSVFDVSGASFVARPWGVGLGAAS